MARIALAQKDYDKVKRAVERITVSIGGSYWDRQGGKFVKSCYENTRGQTFRIDWHSSYSSTRSLKNAKSDAIKHLADWGIDRTQLKRQKGLAFVTGDIEELVLVEWYKNIEREMSVLETDDE